MKMQSNKFISVLIVLSLSLLGAFTSSAFAQGAAVDCTTNNCTDTILTISPPASAAWEQLESNDHSFFWTERSSVVLDTALTVDIITPSGLYDSGVASVEAGWNGDLAPGVYSSFFLHADKQGENRYYMGDITFVTPIEAIIYKAPRLNATDSIFGAPGTTYADGSVRGFELDGALNWFFVVSEDRKTLSFQTYVPHDLDNMRIITSVVPEPISSTLFIVGAATLGFRRFKKKFKK